MSLIVPTITAEDAHIFREQIERVQPFAHRLHIDLMDGIFATNKNIETAAVWWPEGVIADIHLMYQTPATELESLIKLKPNLVIIPAESDSDSVMFAQHLNQADIKCGLAVLPDTSISSIQAGLRAVQHLLIFSGNLGHQGGSQAKLELLQKVAEAKTINSDLEVAWDGGINQSNVKEIVAGGVEVLNVGGYIQTAIDPEDAYTQLTHLLN